jgi:hypothetical protein
MFSLFRKFKLGAIILFCLWASTKTQTNAHASKTTAAKTSSKDHAKSTKKQNDKKSEGKRADYSRLAMKTQPQPQPAALTSNDVALCLIVKDEYDIAEWIDYHFSLGIGRVYVVDNNSTTVPIIPILHSYLKSGLVVYRYVPRPHPPFAMDPHIAADKSKKGDNDQVYAYRLCLTEYGKHHKVMGFIDSDEYIVVKNSSTTLLEILSRYHDFGGLTLNWMMFGSSGHVHRPAGGLRKSYNKCYRNFHVKSFVNTKYTLGPVGPHHFTYTKGHYAVDTNFNRVSGFLNPSNRSLPIPSYLFKTIYLNHYVVRSLEDFLRKADKGSGDGRHKTLHFFNVTDAAATAICPFLLKKNEKETNLSMIPFLKRSNTTS